jgi:GYF domain 2
MSGAWYYAEQGRAIGPMPLSELKQTLAKIEVSTDILVWHEGLQDWQRASGMPELAAIRKLPPPLPSSQTQPTSSPQTKPPVWHAIVAISFLGSVASRAGIDEIARMSATRRKPQRAN